MITHHIIQITLIGIQIWLWFNVFFIIDKIDKLTECVVDSHSFSLSKRMRIIIMITGVFVFPFVPQIKHDRKKYQYEKDLEFYKSYNRNGNKDKEILKLERILKLDRIKRQSKKGIIWQVYMKVVS